MICPDCRNRLHSRCPERARQEDAGLTATERAASSLCDCQHEESDVIRN